MTFLMYFFLNNLEIDNKDNTLIIKYGLSETYIVGKNIIIRKTRNILFS